MFEYKFVRIPASFWGGKPKSDYRKIITEHAQQGWRLIQIFAPTGSSYLPAYFELIFERPKGDTV